MRNDRNKSTMPQSIFVSLFFKEAERTENNGPLQVAA